MSVFGQIQNPEVTTADGAEFCGWKELPSRAVVAMSDDESSGCVLWWVGSALHYEIKDAGMKTLEDLGLQEAPVGISIWEGQYRSVQCGNPSGGYDYESEPVGAFRAPTDEEWAAIRSGTEPWDEKEWWVTKEVVDEARRLECCACGWSGTTAETLGVLTCPKCQTGKWTRVVKPE